MPDTPYRWWRDLTRYHWFVFLVAALGWLFDTMDQQIFVVVKDDAMRELLRPLPDDPKLAAAKVIDASGQATAIFLIGWATGGLAFGVLGDRIGRVKTMILTIIAYSFFTGLSMLSKGFWDFCAYRFLTGLGVGGEFAVGVALVAETMPARARPYVLSLLQASSGVGNITAALIYMGMGQLELGGMFGSGGFLGALGLSPWRLCFVVGALPALLVVLIQRRLKEPDAWKQVAASKDRGSYAALFRHPVWKRHALFGLLLGFSAVVGLWGIGFFATQLQKDVFRRGFEATGLTGDALGGQLKRWAGLTSVMQNLGGMAGIIAGRILAQRAGRKFAFAVSYIAAAVSTAAVFWYLDRPSQVFWLVPLMGFCQLSLFGLLAVYLPELFPTHLRSTGTSFCYNVGRFLAAIGPFIFGILTSSVFVGLAYEPARYAGVVMCSVFALGLVALPFLPETKDKPLPEG